MHALKKSLGIPVIFPFQVIDVVSDCLFNQIMDFNLEVCMNHHGNRFHVSLGSHGRKRHEEPFHRMLHAFRGLERGPFILILLNHHAFVFRNFIDNAVHARLKVRVTLAEDLPWAYIVLSRFKQ